MTPLDELRESVAVRRAELDALRPLRGRALAALQGYFDVELTYTSNAIEGNTLTARETAEVIEHGITVGGKRLWEHLEAVDHYDAVLWMRELANAATRPGEHTVIELHRRIVARSRPDIAGMYSTHARRIRGSPVTFPSPDRLPELMHAFGERLAATQPEAEEAFAVHRELVAIHPFSDGDGRTARLLMNLLLIRGGWPPVAVRPEDRDAYLDALQESSLSGDDRPYQTLMMQRLDVTLADYVGLLRQTLVDEQEAP